MLATDLSKFNTIRIAGIVRESIVDGPGLRFVVFCQGCPHGCKGCHNMETHSFTGGYDCEFFKILDAIEENPLLDGVTFSGGEPFCQPEAFSFLAREIKQRGLNIVCYTGYTYEELQQLGIKKTEILDLLNLTDILIDGRYDETQRDLTLQFRGSKNQRIIDMKQTIEQGSLVICEKYL